MLFRLESLQVSQKSVPLHCVFHGIRFKVNKGWAQRSLWRSSCKSLSVCVAHVEIKCFLCSK